MRNLSAKHLLRRIRHCTRRCRPRVLLGLHLMQRQILLLRILLLLLRRRCLIIRLNRHRDPNLQERFLEKLVQSISWKEVGYVKLLLVVETMRKVSSVIENAALHATYAAALRLPDPELIGTNWRHRFAIGRFLPLRLDQ